MTSINLIANCEKIIVVVSLIHFADVPSRHYSGIGEIYYPKGVNCGE